MFVLVVALPSRALEGTASTASGVLDTVPPALQSVSVATESGIFAYFSEPMLASGLNTPANYTITGPGAGTLGVSPNVAAGSGPVALVWSSGEMRDGALISVTAANLRDSRGNPINPSASSASDTGFGTAPEFFALTVSPAQAERGERVEIRFEASEPLDGLPSVMVNGVYPAAYEGQAKDGAYVYSFTVPELAVLGPAQVLVSGFDFAGNLGTLSSAAALRVVLVSGLPVRAWPVMLVLLCAGVAVLAAGRRRPGAVIGVLALTGVSVAAAPGPTVSNAAFVQRPSGAGGTEVAITFDLDAPNGPCGIEVALSKNGGADGYPYAVTSISGDVAAVTSGTGKEIIWDIAADYPNEYLSNARLRITAEDGVVPVVYTLSYAAGTGGSVSGNTPQLVISGDDGTPVTAVPNLGYAFTGWSDGVLTATRTDVNVTANLTVTANFQQQFLLTYTAGPGGTISGDASQWVAPGGNGTPVTAVPDPGFAFVVWSDGVLTATRSESAVGANFSATAAFVEQHLVSYAAGPGGSISGPALQFVTPGEDAIAVTAVPDSGFGFLIWSDGVTTATRADTNVTNSFSVTASFSPQYKITYAAETGGTISGTTPQWVVSGGDGGAVTAVADANYAFVGWSDGMSGATRSETNVTADFEVTAEFVSLPEMIAVAAGSFDMGSPTAVSGPEYPVHTVTLSAYAIGKYEVTNQQYCDVLNWAHHPSRQYLRTSTDSVWAGTGDVYASGGTALVLKSTAPQNDISFVGGEFVPRTRTGADSVTFDTASHPVHGMDWYGAVCYFNWLSEITGLTPVYDTGTWAANFSNDGYHLPTEAQWERAAAWDGTKHWIFGFTSDTLTGKDRVNFLDWNPDWVNPLGFPSHPRTSPVGWFDGVNVSPNGSVQTQLGVSPIGAYDMSGNILEWCHDWYDAAYYASSPGTDPEGPASGTVRVIRGGSWSNALNNCRSARRIIALPTTVDFNLGIRAAR
jgi:uncharacterized repeat protein (TIGR02543 family)